MISLWHLNTKDLSIFSPTYFHSESLRVQITLGISVLLEISLSEGSRRSK